MFDEGSGFRISNTDRHFEKIESSVFLSSVFIFDKMCNIVVDSQTLKERYTNIVTRIQLPESFLE